MNFVVNPKRCFAVRRRGSTYLEVQVAMVMLAIGVTGLYSMSVVQTRQTARLSELIEDGVDQAVNPSASTWAQKLGVYAAIDPMDDPGDVPQARPAVLSRVQANVIRDDSSSVGVYMSDSGAAPYWVVQSSSDAYGGTFHEQSSAYDGGWIQLNIPGLTPGRYEVYTTYPESATAGQSVRHWVYGDKGWSSPIVVNQRLAPADLDHDGQSWRNLGVHTTDSGWFAVHISNWNINGSHIRGDAVLARNASTMEVVSVVPSGVGGFTAVLEDSP